MKKITLFLFLGSSFGVLFGMKKDDDKKSTNNPTPVSLYALKNNNNKDFQENNEEDYNNIPSNKGPRCKNRVAQQDLSPRGIHDLPI